MAENSSKPPKSKSWIEYFLAPFVTALVLFGLNFFFGPTIDKKKAVATDVWLQKKEAIIKAADLVSEKYQSLRFNSKDTSSIIFDNYSDVNSIYFKLLLLCDNEKVASSFWKFFDDRTNSFTAVERAEFYSMLKMELIGKSLTTPSDSIPVLKSPKYFSK